jgi:hypothetical protein
MVSGTNRTKMVYALWIISNRTEKKNSRLYQSAREDFGELMRERKHTAESKAKMSASQKGKVRTPEQRRHLSEINLGKERNFSETHRSKLSEAGKGRQFTDEWKAKLSAANKGQGAGRKLSDETKAKLSAARKATLARIAAEKSSANFCKIPDQSP